MSAGAAGPPDESRPLGPSGPSGPSGPPGPAGLVLVVEHEPAVAELERRYLAREGFEVAIEADPARAPAVAAWIRPDVIVLDLSDSALPADLYRRVADAAPAVPIVPVVDGPAGAEAAGHVPHRVTRPFGPRVLVGAVGEALRRDGAADPPGMLRAGRVVLDPRGRTALVDDRRAGLTATEFDLLQFLMGNAGRVFTREQLLDAAWGPGAGAGSRTVDVHVAQLRAKLGAGNPIRTVRGVGYVLDA